jgi:cytochrome c-type biogenesis protein CcmH
MPLAAVKLKASDLPTIVVLNNSQAMSPQNTLSSVDKVHVYAIVSKQGNVGIKSGDYKAEALAVSVNSDNTLELKVDHLVE